MPAPPPPAAAKAIFGDRLRLAVRYAELLAGSGVERGLLGPREAGRIWQRHLLNCAVIGEVLPSAARVVDVGSGAGLPGLPLALARPDLEITLLEPMARRVAWLTEVVDELAVPVRVYRGRAEDVAVRSALGPCDAVTARAVAPLGRLAAWTLPLLGPGGLLVAMKGETAGDEVVGDGPTVRRYGGRALRVHDCGAGIVDPLTRVVLVERSEVTAREHRRAKSEERTERGAEQVGHSDVTAREHRRAKSEERTERGAEQVGRSEANRIGLGRRKHRWA